jgi:Domain of unknown function (DUF4276)
MSKFFVAPIVEGHGEVQAVPILLERILRESHAEGLLRVNPPLRVKAGSFINDEEYFKRYVELAARKAKPQARGSVLILLDSEDSCPAELRARLAAKAAALRPDVSILVALAYREYETWFLAAARSLQSVCGLPADLEPPTNPESIRGAKGWLSRQMPNAYNEPNDQPAMTRKFSFEQASTIHSFNRLKRKLTDLFAAPDEAPT